jgi:pSer/pThr/pTyr-binding forkhead associated (FHA) protein
MAILLVLRGPDEGRQFELRHDEIPIGRSVPAALGVLLDSRSVSRVHACIFREQGQYLLADQKSRNGTRVNGERLRPESRVPLRDGDRIEICNYVLVFLV